MKSKIGILLIATYVSSTWALPPCMCTRNLRPVCGTNGVTYSNACLLRCAGAELEHDGKCSPAQPGCDCRDPYRPVCGSDGTTYLNDCDLNCATAHNSGLRVAHEGECAKPPQPPCVCPQRHDPLCGSDGNTYDNDCELNCATANDSTLRVAHSGPCSSEDSSDPAYPPCICTQEYQPICGSDGKTYGNDCELNCATAHDSTLRVSHSGACPSENPSDPAYPPCICTQEYQPICGSDGKTYGNDCELNCATAHDSTLRVSHSGACPSENPSDPAYPPCICTQEYQPICGSDGKTYGNDCELNCATAHDSTLRVSHSGACSIANVTLPHSCICPQYFSPVCDNNGKRYSNDCFFNCERKNDPSLTIGPCRNDVSPYPPCECTDDYKPLCGSDMRTYANDCELNCATANDNTLKVAHEGACESQPSCPCSLDEYNPVCGTDTITYTNPCFLNCATAFDSTLRVLSDGHCPENLPVPVPVPVIMPREA